MKWFHCRECREVNVLTGSEEVCPSCGSISGHVESNDKVMDLLEKGVYYSLGPNGKPLKPKK
ncbi:MAG: hypothetical protein CME36_09745 [unclassified Hahellaceae]|nr:hypothetical protein [Hahellaceae bacterium]|tara:strand:- start:27584 stop:27769 length:186 start_codon:yes stop_codon:yes gene_type:complete